MKSSARSKRSLMSYYCKGGEEPNLTERLRVCCWTHTVELKILIPGGAWVAAG